MIEQAKFTYFQLGKALGKQLKTVKDKGKKQIKSIEDHRKQLVQSNAFVIKDVNIDIYSIILEEQKKVTWWTC